MRLSDFINEGNNDSYYAYHDAAKKWAKDNGKDPREFSRAGTDVQDKYIEPEMKKHGLVPDRYQGKGVTSYKRENIEEKQGYCSDKCCGADVKAEDCWCDADCPHCDCNRDVEEGTRCWKGYEKKGMKTMFGKRVPNCVKKEGLEEEKDGMIGTPDRWYDEEERRDAWEDLQVAIDGARNQDEIEMIEDGVCPNCAGSGYQDGEYEVYNDETDEYEEGYECDGWGSYGCDEGEMQGATWKEIMAYDEQNVQRQQAKDNYPGDEEVIKQIASYMKHMDDPRLAYQQVQADYPHLGRAQRGELIGKASKLAFGESIEEANENNEAMVAKMLAKALGDDNRWTEMSPYELYSELESQNPEVADMLAKVAIQLYDVKLQERAYKDVGVADVHKDARGKEFKFDKDSKKFKSLDGEEADPKTKLGKDLMRQRRNAMKKSSPSYNKKKAPNKPSLISQIFGK